MTSDNSAFFDALATTYIVERELGRGGMATVYLARELHHRRLVALKVLRESLAVELGAERFLREIETAARLQHPHILPVFDSGETAGRLWFTMPYVEGETLRQRLERKPRLDDGRGAAHRARGGAGARVCPPARGHPPRHQAREHPPDR